MKPKLLSTIFSICSGSLFAKYQELSNSTLNTNDCRAKTSAHEKVIFSKCASETFRGLKTPQLTESFCILKGPMLSIGWIFSLLFILMDCGAQSSGYGSDTKANNENKSEGVIFGKYFIKVQGSQKFNEEIHRITKRIYFSDSSVIFELTGLKIFQDFDEPETYERLIMGYIFHELNTQSYYTYKSLSDTATLQMAFKQPDTASLDGAWNFKRGFRPPLCEMFNLSGIGDTLVVDDVLEYRDIERKYKIMYGASKYPELEPRQAFLFFQLDSIPSFLTYDQELTKDIGLPITRVDLPYIGLNGEDIYMSMRLYLERGYLTNEEKKVFKVWAEYAKNHPLK
jgi:hypothetical protein